MPSIDPEREAVGRSIAAVLMARQIRQGGQIHAETVLTEIGALAGFAAQMSIRKGVIEPQGLEPNALLVEIVTKNDEKYYFSDLLNWILFENLDAPPYSIWAYVRDAVPERSKDLLPDVPEIVGRAARTIGTTQFGVPHVPAAHMPQTTARAALQANWRAVQRELVVTGRDPSDWPYDLASAAQWQMLTSRERLPPPVAARIVMEAAIPMSKIDPLTVPGA
jgi:hypothetical protein